VSSGDETELSKGFSKDPVIGGPVERCAIDGEEHFRRQVALHRVEQLYDELRRKP
jgi:hypothetical protein